jgi:hypothetical protein
MVTISVAPTRVLFTPVGHPAVEGQVTQANLTKGVVTVEYERFGRKTSTQINPAKLTYLEKPSDLIHVAAEGQQARLENQISKLAHEGTLVIGAEAGKPITTPVGTTIRFPGPLPPGRDLTGDTAAFHIAQKAKAEAQVPFTPVPPADLARATAAKFVLPPPKVEFGKVGFGVAAAQVTQQAAPSEAKAADFTPLTTPPLRTIGAEPDSASHTKQQATELATQFVQSGFADPKLELAIRKIGLGTATEEERKLAFEVIDKPQIIEQQAKRIAKDPAAQIAAIALNPFEAWSRATSEQLQLADKIRKGTATEQEKTLYNKLADKVREEQTVAFYRNQLQQYKPGESFIETAGRIAIQTETPQVVVGLALGGVVAGAGKVITGLGGAQKLARAVQAGTALAFTAPGVASTVETFTSPEYAALPEAEKKLIQAKVAGGTIFGALGGGLALKPGRVGTLPKVPEPIVSARIAPREIAVIPKRPPALELPPGIPEIGAPPTLRVRPPPELPFEFLRPRRAEPFGVREIPTTLEERIGILREEHASPFAKAAIEAKVKNLIEDQIQTRTLRGEMLTPEKIAEARAPHTIERLTAIARERALKAAIEHEKQISGEQLKVQVRESRKLAEKYDLPIPKKEPDVAGFFERIERDIDLTRAEELKVAKIKQEQASLEQAYKEDIEALGRSDFISTHKKDALIDKPHISTKAPEVPKLLEGKKPEAPIPPLADFFALLDEPRPLHPTKVSHVPPEPPLGEFLARVTEPRPLPRVRPPAIEPPIAEFFERIEAPVPPPIIQRVAGEVVTRPKAQIFTLKDVVGEPKPLPPGARITREGLIVLEKPPKVRPPKLREEVRPPKLLEAAKELALEPPKVRLAPPKVRPIIPRVFPVPIPRVFIGAEVRPDIGLFQPVRERPRVEEIPKVTPRIDEKPRLDLPTIGIGALTFLGLATATRTGVAQSRQQARTELLEEPRRFPRFLPGAPRGGHIAPISITRGRGIARAPKKEKIFGIISEGISKKLFGRATFDPAVRELRGQIPTKELKERGITIGRFFRAGGFAAAEELGVSRFLERARG